MLLVVCAQMAVPLPKKKALTMYRIIGFCSVLGGAGCVPAQPPIAPLVVCGAGQRADLLGQPLAALQAAGLPPGVRVIRPGDAVTEDYSDQRLNVDLDANDRVTRLWCG